MKTIIAIAVCMGVLACGEDKKKQPLECNRTDRSGTYLIHYEEHSGGGCGPLTDEVVTFDRGLSEVGPDCTLNYERWSDGDCKLERSLGCDSVADGLHFEVTMVSRQKDSSGELLAGTMTGIIYDLNTAEWLCTSTYDLTATRQ